MPRLRPLFWLGCSLFFSVFSLMYNSTNYTADTVNDELLLTLHMHPEGQDDDDVNGNSTVSNTTEHFLSVMDEDEKGEEDDTDEEHSSAQPNTAGEPNISEATGGENDTTREEKSAATSKAANKELGQKIKAKFAKFKKMNPEDRPMTKKAKKFKAEMDEDMIRYQLMHPRKHGPERIQRHRFKGDIRKMREFDRETEYERKKRFASGASRLEFVHITKTGGTAIEKAASERRVTWGLCHFEMRKDIGPGCKNPTWGDPSTPERTDAPIPFFGEYWHTPPHWLSPNPFQSAEATFTVVRNPYERILSEYYCKYFGYHREYYKINGSKKIDQEKKGGGGRVFGHHGDLNSFFYPFSDTPLKGTGASRRQELYERLKKDREKRLERRGKKIEISAGKRGNAGEGRKSSALDKRLEMIEQYREAKDGLLKAQEQVRLVDQELKRLQREAEGAGSARRRLTGIKELSEVNEKMREASEEKRNMVLKGLRSRPVGQRQPGWVQRLFGGSGGDGPTPRRKGWRRGGKPRAPREDTVESLNTWIRKSLMKGINLDSGHLMPQAFYVYNTEGEQVIDHVLRFENLQNEFSALMNKYDMPVVLQEERINSGHASEKSGRLSVRDLHRSTIKLINKFFDLDFQAFGYKKIKDGKDWKG